MALYDPDQHRPLAFVFGADPGVICGLYGGLSLWVLGYPQQADAGMDRAIVRAREIAHGHTEAFALTYQSFHCLCRREVPATRQWAEAAIAVASKLGIRQWSAWSANLQGWTLAMQGEAEKGIRQLQDSLDDWRVMGIEAFVVPHFLRLLAEALASGGRLEEALAAVSEALSVARDTEQRCWEAELYRVQGELLLAASPGDSTEAEACFHRALEVARQQQARSWELRVAMSLARLWRGQGRADDARALLAPVYDWFSEGFDTADLKEAKALLDELAPPALSKAVG
jgi:predicted ATPase